MVRGGGGAGPARSLSLGSCRLFQIARALMPQGFAIASHTISTTGSPRPSGTRTLKPPF
jgi:hypothetical protein